MENLFFKKPTLLLSLIFLVNPILSYSADQYYLFQVESFSGKKAIYQNQSFPLYNDCINSALQHLSKKHTNYSSWQHEAACLSGNDSLTIYNEDNKITLHRENLNNALIKDVLNEAEKIKLDAKDVISQAWSDKTKNITQSLSSYQAFNSWFVKNHQITALQVRINDFLENPNNLIKTDERVAELLSLWAYHVLETDWEYQKHDAAGNQIFRKSIKEYTPPFTSDIRKIHMGFSDVNMLIYLDSFRWNDYKNKDIWSEIFDNDQLLDQAEGLINNIASQSYNREKYQKKTSVDSSTSLEKQINKISTERDSLIKDNDEYGSNDGAISQINNRIKKLQSSYEKKHVVTQKADNLSVSYSRKGRNKFKNEFLKWTETRLNKESSRKIMADFLQILSIAVNYESVELASPESCNIISCRYQDQK